MPRAKRPQRPRQAADEARSVHAQLRPPSIERAIARPQLERALTRATAPIVWLHAPAGAGKPLGLAHFVARRNAGCLWYGLDAEDRDPGNLVAALGLALAGDLGSVQPPRLAPIPESAFELEVRRLTDRVMRELWPERSPLASRSAFDTAVHRLRRSLGDEGMVPIDNGAIRLAREHVWVDVWALESLSAALEKLPPHASSEAVQRFVERLLAVYRGPFQAGGGSPSVERCRERANGASWQGCSVWLDIWSGWVRWTHSASSSSKRSRAKITSRCKGSRASSVARRT
jgi:hypothetical protein